MTQTPAIIPPPPPAEYAAIFDQVQNNHDQVAKLEGTLKASVPQYYLWCLRAGASLAALKEQLPHGSFEKAAQQFLSGIPERSRQRYMHLYNVFTERAGNLLGPGTEQAAQEDPGDDAEAIDVEVEEVGTPAPASATRQNGDLHHLLRCDHEEFARYIGNQRRLESACGKIRRVMGDRWLTSMGRAGGFFPARDKGKPRGKYQTRAGERIERSVDDQIETVIGILQVLAARGHAQKFRRILDAIERAGWRITYQLSTPEQP